MRCTVQRNYTTDTDAFGHVAAQHDWQTHLDGLPCFYWSRSKAEIMDGEKTAAVEQLSLMVPAGTDVTEGDRIVNVTDRRFASIRPGIMEVLTVQRRAGYLALALRGID